MATSDKTKKLQLLGGGFASKKQLDNEYVRTYILKEGETIENAPEWAEEVIDPFSESEVIQGPKGEDGSDANVTAQTIKNALGYAPANTDDVETLSKEIEDTVKTTAQEFTEEQQNQARANIGVYHDMYGLLEISVSGYEGKEIETGISFVEGQEVTVFVDGVENKYTVQSATFEENDEVYTSIYVGDNPFDESGDNGFFIESLSDGMILIVNRTDEMHIYGIYANQSIKIPKKYMPINCNFYIGSQLPFDYSLYKVHRADGFMVYMVSDLDAQEKFKQYEFMLSQQGIYVREDSDNRTWCDYMTIDLTQNIGETIKKNESTVFITSHDGYLSFCELHGVTPIE